MAKYYVQSGTLRTVIQAESARKAAIWAIHQVLGQVLPTEDDFGGPISTEFDDGNHCLARRVRVSQRGFDRKDAATHLTHEVVGEWSQLVSTLDRLQSLLTA